MTVPAPDAFADLLSTLDRDAFVSLVADLWRARGQNASREGDVLIVTDGDETRRLLPVARRRFRGVVPSLADHRNVDLVVDRDGSAAEAAAERGVDYVGPTELRSRTLYEIDRSDAEDLFREYFDRSLDDGEPSRPPARVAGDSAAGDTDASSVWGGSTAVLLERGSALVLVLLVVTAGVTALGIDPFSPGGAFGGDGSIDYNVTSINGSGNFSVGAVSGSGVSWAYPPGVSENNVNGSALAEADARLLQNRSYRVHITSTSRLQGDGDEPRRSSETTTLYLANRTSFFERMNHTAVDRGNVRRVRMERYANESYRFERQLENGTSTFYLKQPRTQGDAPLTSVKASIQAYLGRSGATVTPTDGSDGRYRIVVTSPPKAVRIFGTLTQYKATAVVDSSGFVSRLDVAYSTVDSSNGRQFVDSTRISFRFTDVGSVAVPQPPWVDDARRRLRGTPGATSVVVDNRTTTATTTV